MSDTPAENLPRRMFGKYQIIRELGRGAMGVVYEALDPFLDRRVALKTIHKDLLQDGTLDAESTMQRFRREAQAAARMHHPNIVVVYDYAEDGDTAYFAMELVHGRELREWLTENRRFNLPEIINLMLQLLDGVGYSHQHQVIHRDLKPANIILLNGTGRVKIADFGVARLGASDLTQVGEVVGTLTYMAPEQLQGLRVDGRADLFSAGVIFYELLTGRKPFVGDSLVAVMQSILTFEPPPPSNRNSSLPPLCDAILKKALAKAPDARFQNAKEFQAALRALLKQKPASAAAPTAPAATAAAVPVTPAVAQQTLARTLVGTQIIPPAAAAVDATLVNAAPTVNLSANATVFSRTLAATEAPTVMLNAAAAPSVVAAVANPAPASVEILDESDSDDDLPRGLDAWVDYLTQQEMPIFSLSSRRVSQAMDSTTSSAMELSRIIQQDPTLAAKLLRLANSVYYNPARVEVPNINRAIVVLGLKTIRDLTLACAFVESVSGPDTEQVNRTIARAIHSAVQAKSLAGVADDPAPDEVFVAALLGGIGHVAFWCYGRSACIRLKALLQGGEDPETAERQVLGFTLNELDAALCKAWHLGGLIEACASGNAEGDRAQRVYLSQRLARDLEHGFDTPQARACLKDIARTLGKPAVQIEGLVRRNVSQAAGVATQFGARGAGTLILQSAKAQPDERPLVDMDQREHWLQEISHLLSGEFDINKLFNLVVDGMSKAVGLDRVMFALISPAGTRLREKLSRGLGRDERKNALEFDLNSEANVFSYTIGEKQPCWLNPGRDARLYTPHVCEQLGRQECLLVPVQLNNRVLGLFYGDRALRRRPLDRQALDLFIEFALQASIGMDIAHRNSTMVGK